MINSISLIELQQQFGGKLINGDACFQRLVIDSRQVQANDLFVAIKGERFDSHQFIPQVIASGAGALVVSQPQDSPLPQWLVPDTQIALGQIAQFNRQRFKGPTVAITGNSGKTTVKEMLGCILSLSGQPLITQGNFNNEIGVPLTLLRLEQEHTSAIIELGANHLGEIAYTTELTQPDIGVVMNVTGAHLGEFGSIANIAQAKGELIQGLSKKGLAVINADDAFAGDWCKLAGDRSVVLYGIHSRESSFSRKYPLVYAEDLKIAETGYGFTLCLPGSKSELSTAVDADADADVRAESRVKVQLNVPAKHNVSNALAAASAAYALGIQAEQIASGLALFSGVSGRLQVIKGLGGATVLNDSYNANPGSVRAAIDTLMDFNGKTYLVLGDIGELGDSSLSAHAELGRYAKQAGVDQLYTVGDFSEQAALSFGAGAIHWPDQQSLIDALKQQLQVNTTVLVKGSRSAAMELVAEQLKFTQ